MGTYVQYGCGTCAPDGWLNYDASPTLRLQKIPVVGALAPGVFPKNALYGDICKGLPLADGSVDVIYCSHVLEHLTLNDVRQALKNTLKVLKPGGIFRLVLPDMKAIAKEYVESADPLAAVHFMNHSVLGRHSRPKGMTGAIRAWIGNSEHQWMWDYDSLAIELKKTGFENIRRAQFGDSGDAMLEKVEDKARWEGTVLGLQCQRPG